MSLPNTSHALAANCVFLAASQDAFVDYVSEAAPAVVGTAFSAVSTPFGSAIEGNGASYLNYGARPDIATTGATATSFMAMFLLQNSGSAIGSLLGKSFSNWSINASVQSSQQQFSAGLLSGAITLSYPSSSVANGLLTFDDHVVCMVVTWDGSTQKIALRDLTSNGAVLRNSSAKTGTMTNQATTLFNLMARGSGAGIMGAGAALIAAGAWSSAIPDAAVDSFLADPLALLAPAVPADTTAPTLNAASATAVIHSTATGSITTDEAGPAWAVLTTSATAPSVARVKAGLDHAGVGAAAADTANLVVGANAPAFAFTGLSGSTTYYLHVVQDDTATPANTSTVATSASFATPAAPKHATYQFDVDEAGTDAASVTGLTWAWYEAYPPALAALPLLSGTAGSTDASGVFDVVLTGTALNVGDTGTLVICKGDGVEGSVANIGFIGPVEVR